MGLALKLMLLWASPRTDMGLALKPILMWASTLGLIPKLIWASPLTDMGLALKLIMWVSTLSWNWCHCAVCCFWLVGLLPLSIFYLQHLWTQNKTHTKKMQNILRVCMHAWMNFLSRGVRASTNSLDDCSVFSFYFFLSFFFFLYPNRYLWWLLRHLVNMMRVCMRFMRYVQCM